MHRPLARVRFLGLLAILPAWTACEIGPFELGSIPGSGGGLGGAYRPTEVIVSAPLEVGTYPAVFGEAVVRLYPGRDADPAQLVDSVMSSGGEYRFFLGQAPATEVCDYWVHVERWDGVVVEPVDLLPDLSAPCELDLGSYPGSAVALPGYDPLPEPFTVEGRVFVDGDSAAAAGIRVTLPLRSSGADYPEAGLTVGDDGRWSYATTSGAERYRFCAGVEAAVEDPTYGGFHWIYLDRLSAGGCSMSRELRPLRFGQVMAATGTVFRDQRSSERVGLGEVRLQLIDPADSTPYGAPVPTSDDGRFDLWLEPGDERDICDWMLRAEMEGRDPVVVPLNPPGYCATGGWVDVDFGG